MGFIYRKMTIADYDKAVTLWTSLPGMGLSGADEKDEIKRFLAMNPNTCWVAVSDQTIVGTILGGNDGRRGYIYHFAVRKNLQGQGIGGELLKRCLNALTNAGIQKCHLMVYQDNHSGIKFWEHAGWIVRKDVHTMSKELTRK